MELKDLLQFNKGDINTLIVNYYQTRTKREDLKFTFEDYLGELQVCPICGEINKDEDMEYHKWDLANEEEKICVACKENE